MIKVWVNYNRLITTSSLLFAISCSCLDTKNDTTISKDFESEEFSSVFTSFLSNQLQLLKVFETNNEVEHINEENNKKVGLKIKDNLLIKARIALGLNVDTKLTSNITLINRIK